MVRLSRLCLVLLAAACLAVCLPDFYWKVFDRKIKRPFFLYSPEIDRFMYRISDEFGQVAFRDEDGREYSRIEWETHLPFFYYRDLKKWGKLPENVGGFAMDCDAIRAETQVVGIYPDYLHDPQIDLYPLFESKSMFSDLEFPDDMFRINSRMEFVSASTNEVDEEKSAAFTGNLAGAGFRFPAHYIAGNPSTRKPFDEGYFVLDDSGMLFHIKMVEGEPRCIKTGTSPPGGIRYMGVRENARREFHGIVVCGNGDVCFLGYRNYELIKLPVDGYDPDNSSLRIITDPLFRTITCWDLEGGMIRCVATDRNYEVKRQYEFPLERDHLRFAETLSRSIFPFTIETQSPKSNYVLFRFRFSGWACLAGIAASLLIVVIVRRIRSVPLSRCFDDLLVVAFTGLFGLLAVLIAGRERNPDRD